ncbi:hypothetical protein [Streptomyces niveus]|uniref:hypothetical protein n=1 Tax=Streptomyces niveus TaxID=193462 RepID=UPI000AFEF0BC|nr:hypothetical protein [Streptomyces niveus]
MSASINPYSPQLGRPLNGTCAGEPPLHLVLGRDAVDYVADKMRTPADGDARRAELGRSVDFD